MKRLFLALAALVMTTTATAQTAQTTQNQIQPSTEWFEQARYGMFVHFGPYAVLADGEWIMNTRPIKTHNYLDLQDIFNPQAFDAKEWVKTAKDAGMKYMIVTSRHHDSFSNWATKQSDWNIMNTPYGKDLLKQLADECRVQGMKLGFYYSLLDWMRDDYQWRTGRTGQNSGRTAPSDWNHYIEFMKAQLTELLTGYGDVAVIWFDGHWDQTADKNRTNHKTAVDWRYPEIYELIHKLQPNCLIANNHHLPLMEGESYQIFERDVPGQNTAGHSGQAISEKPLETCQTINGSWGYRITDNDYKSVPQLIKLLASTAGMGANLLLNVGPRPDGRIDPVSVSRLQEVGQWLGKWGHTIYGTRRGWFAPTDKMACTMAADGKTYYIHVFDPAAASFTFDDAPGKVRSAKLLTGGDLRHTYKKGVLTLILPADTANLPSRIVEVTMR